MPIEHIAILREGDDGEEKLALVETIALAPWDKKAKLQVVGRAHARTEGIEKVTGRAQYAYDVRLPGQLYTAALRSPYPHAKIRRIDTTRAEQLSGVHAVLSSANAPAITWYAEECGLFAETVRFVGDEVAVVAAESEEIARDALRLIEVDYEPLPFVVDLATALQPDAPRVHGKGNQTAAPKIYERGNLEQGFQAADVVLTQEYTTQTQVHNSLEPHGCTAFWQGDQLTLWESTQGIFEVREQVAEKLGLPEHHVRVIKEHMGGGFGSKQVAWKQTVIAALLSRQTGRPVQFMLDREGENLAAGSRGQTWQQLRLGAKRDGTLTALAVDIRIVNGAYSVGGEAADVSGMYQRLYRCPNLRTEQVAVYLNTGPSVAFRAPGHAEAAFALESILDELAQALAMDPVELRLRNYTEIDPKKNKPFSSPQALRTCYEQVTAAFGWQTYQPPAPTGTKRRGIGFAAHEWGGGGNPPAYAWVKINGDGTADVITGAQDIGTGARTGLLLVAAEELGLPVDQVTVHLGDTAVGPYAPTSAGSATQVTVGPAVRAAAADAKRQLLEAAAKLLEEDDPTHLQLQDGVITLNGSTQSRVTVKEVAGRLAPHMILGHGLRGANPKDVSIRTFGAQCAEVEVDLATGEITLLRVAAAHDCGRIINPLTVESQIIGGVTQGIGFALTEERFIDAQTGIVLNATLEEYKVPTVADIPPITNAPVDLPDTAANPTGAKGIGEPPLIPTAPAIANAVFAATGIRLRHAPLTRRALLTALAERKGQG
ncbi:MAG: xanthine dehydrogenase family protein molybdopterin-binding subunit [Caldilineaceae bacterium]|nr:xanthine dehydrogenase family protein molybdopterin-binding subunit [Caldilineaceae bacterium]